MMLGDLGAAMIKIEAPQGDGTRRYGTDINGEALDISSSPIFRPISSPTLVENR
jgi:crotonobetainyl-CoA:carnitine CoA-transferase CaiB-like acyl-CoA transferase